jgi:hypothetical protein
LPALLPAAVAIGFVIASLNATRTFYALPFFAQFSNAMQRNFRRKSSHFSEVDWNDIFRSFNIAALKC